jgi:hypothetical protein
MSEFWHSTGLVKGRRLGLRRGSTLFRGLVSLCEQDDAGVAVDVNEIRRLVIGTVRQCLGRQTVDVIDIHSQLDSEQQSLVVAIDVEVTTTC